VAGWFLGSETGHALADILFGTHSPSGRLPVSFAQVSGQQPFFYNHKRTGRPQVLADESLFKSRYREVNHSALYPFGHGLTYGDVVYAGTQVSAQQLAWGGTVEVSATLHNQGRRAAREVAQLYIRQRVASMTRPVRELKGFKAVALEPGQSATVRFVLSRHDLAFVQADLGTAAEPGVFDLWVAPNATAGSATTVTLLPNVA
jgi:beta-glucosidase